MDCSYCLLKRENSKKLSAVIGDNETAAYWQQRTSSLTGSIMTLLPALAHLNPSHMSQIITIFIPSCSKRQVAQMQCRPLELNSAWCFSTSSLKTTWHTVATKLSEWQTLPAQLLSTFHSCSKGRHSPALTALAQSPLSASKVTPLCVKKGVFPSREIEEQLVMAGVRQTWIKLFTTLG